MLKISNKNRTIICEIFLIQFLFNVNYKLNRPTFVQSNWERRAKSGTTNSSINHYSRNAYPYSSHQRYNEDNENSIFTGYVSMTEFLKQYKETNERISRLESLVWKMLNNVIL